MARVPGWRPRLSRKKAIRNCAKKRVFKTVDDATAYAARFKGNMRVYPCAECGEYHLTTNRDE